MSSKQAESSGARRGPARRAAEAAAASDGNGGPLPSYTTAKNMLAAAHKQLGQRISELRREQTARALAAAQEQLLLDLLATQDCVLSLLEHKWPSLLAAEAASHMDTDDGPQSSMCSSSTGGDSHAQASSSACDSVHGGPAASNYVVSLLQAATPEQVRRAAGMSSEAWRQMNCGSFGHLVALLELLTRTSEAGLPDAMQQLESTVDEIVTVTYTMLFVNVHPIYQALQNNLLTGEASCAPMEHWLTVARRLCLTREQQLHLRAALDLHNRVQRAAASAQQEVLGSPDWHTRAGDLRSAEAAAEPQPASHASAGGGEAHGVPPPPLDKLMRRLLQRRALNGAWHALLTTNILTKLQSAQAIVASFPHAVITTALAEAASHLLDQEDQEAQQQQQQQQQQPPPGQEGVPPGLQLPAPAPTDSPLQRLMRQQAHTHMQRRGAELQERQQRWCAMVFGEGSSHTRLA